MSNKNKASALNAITAVILTLSNGLLGLAATRFIISEFGSDFNGLNSTANQIVNVLLLLEGGFTVASNVALFAPLGQENFSQVNGILTATRSKFRKIGLLFLAAGLLVAGGYTFAVNSELPPELIFTVLWMTVLPAAVNLYFATTYRVLLQAQQREYVINCISALTIGLGHIVNIILIIWGGQMWMVRLVTMLFSFLNSLLIVLYVRRHNKFLDFKVPEQSALIKGTNDVLVQKITGVVYSSAPIIFLSVFPAGGTVLASIYAAYNNVFTMIKSLLHAVIDAPRLSLGQLLTERDRDEIWTVFAQYELLAFMAVSVLLSTTYAMILSFISLYTVGITDANYVDPIIAVLMTVIALVEMIHIPSGHLLNMAGLFRVSRNIQVIACVALFICMPVGGFFLGIYGMLGALLFVAVLLAIMEMGYVHIRFFSKGVSTLMKLLLPNTIIGAVVAVAESFLAVRYIDGMSHFLIFGVLSVSINLVAVFTTNIIFQRSLVVTLFHRVRNVLVKGKRSRG